MRFHDFFIYAHGFKLREHSIFKPLKIESFIRLFILITSNYLIPIYFKLTNLIFKTEKINGGSENAFIVSFTTFPERIEKIWLVVECLLRQKTKPDKLILWLSKDQFPSKDILPSRLLNLEKRGLEIVLCNGDLKSHKKYFYTLTEYPEDILVTVDDDFFYPSTLLSDLLRLHKKYPNAICCERAYLMKVENGELSPYGSWKYLLDGFGPSFEVFQTSGGGTLYPSGSLHPEVLNKDIFLKYCKTADDVWLNIMSQLNFTQIIKSDKYYELLPIISNSVINLSTVNVLQGQNDKQLKKVREIILEKFHIDPFQKLLSKKSILK